MISLQVTNNQRFNLSDIPFFEKDMFCAAVSEGLSAGYRMLALFPLDKNSPHQIVAVLADDESALLQVTGGEFITDNLEFMSFAERFPQTNFFECELMENHGFHPLSHPWLRPVRQQSMILGNQPYNFYKMSGDEVHEVAVGPIHAGVIEPGHFRFQCHGEMVYHLEINLGYQHRGVEKLMLNDSPVQRIILAESIAGDTTVAHTLAHCIAVEQLSEIQVSLRAQVIRAIAEELERIAMHIAGLGGIANDIGLAIASSSYGRLRTLVINSMAALCGSRFGRGLLIYGGVRFDFKPVIIKQIISNLDTVKKDLLIINNFMFSATSALNRFNETGIVSTEFARQIGLVGMAARSCGLELDTRTNFPYGAYHYFPISTQTLITGDVFARAKLRELEINESFRFIAEQLSNLPQGEIKAVAGKMAADSAVISLTEGWRGEVMHMAITDSDGKFKQYKIKDPSFNNWYGLGLALRQTAISDFPLCNKSFDLSYAGHDL